MASRPGWASRCGQLARKRPAIRGFARRICRWSYPSRPVLISPLSGAIYVVDPADIPRVVSDAALLVRDGNIIVFGSAALAFRLPNAPKTRDVDLWCEPPERGDIVTVFMGELSWYSEKHGTYVEVWGPETFAAPQKWRSRAQVLTNDDAPLVRLIIPHPHDILLAKLERWEPQDRTHASLILAAFPLSAQALGALVFESPYRAGRITDAERLMRFEAHLKELTTML